MQVIATMQGLLWKDYGLTTLASMSSTELLLHRRLPMYYTLSDEIYVCKRNGSIFLFHYSEFTEIELKKEALRFIRVYDEGAMLARGGGNSAIATIGGVTIDGRRVPPADTTYILSTSSITFTISGNLMRVLMLMQGGSL